MGRASPHTRALDENRNILDCAISQCFVFMSFFAPMFGFGFLCFFFGVIACWGTPLIIRFVLNGLVTYILGRLAISCLLASPFGGSLRDAWKRMVGIINLIASVVLLLCLVGLMITGWSYSPLRWLASRSVILVGRTVSLITYGCSSELIRSLGLVGVVTWWWKMPWTGVGASRLGATSPVTDAFLTKPLRPLNKFDLRFLHHDRVFNYICSAATRD
jgi:hypothetical protein